MRLALATGVLALAGCTSLPNLQSFLGETPQQRCAAQHQAWRLLIVYQSDGSGSWRTECVKPAPSKPVALNPESAKPENCLVISTYPAQSECTPN